MTVEYEKHLRKRRLQPQLLLIASLRNNLDCINLNYDGSIESAKLVAKQIDIIGKLQTLERHVQRFIDLGGTKRPEEDRQAELRRF